MIFHANKSVYTPKIMANFPSHGLTFVLFFSEKVNVGIFVNGVTYF